jgi:hypothetical protein
MDLFPARFFFEHGLFVSFSFQESQFPLEFDIAVKTGLVEAAVRECGLYRAAGFAAVGAVAEPAGGGQFFNTGKTLADGRIGSCPQLKFAHAGSVDHRTAGRKDDQFPVGGCMAAAVEYL